MKARKIELPPHEASLHLDHNDHKSYYCTVLHAIENEGLYDHDDWVSEEQKKKAIATDDCWSLIWHPNTPVGFNRLLAADLDVLLDAALAMAAGSGEEMK